MPKPNRTKVDQIAKRIAKMNELMTKFQAKIDAMGADGEITAEEQEQIDDLEEVMTKVQDRIDKLSGPV